ncbi:MAG: fluoride efflux transporter CrcB [Opitutus sp.]
MISQILWIALGSALGGVTRFALSAFAAQRWGDNFPWGTLIVNITGSFLIGFFATLTQPDGRFAVGGTTRQFVMTGIFGGYTTYSSFSLQTLLLAQEGEWLRAGSYATGTFVLCFVAVWLGHLCATYLHPMKGS